jgi:hypothetical protein
MFFGRIRGSKAEGLCDLGAGRGKAGVFNGIPDQPEDLFLAGGKFEHGSTW